MKNADVHSTKAASRFHTTSHSFEWQCICFYNKHPENYVKKGTIKFLIIEITHKPGIICLSYQSQFTVK